ncbi:MAG: alkaline phosphatase family protein [Candidatus Baltobacteraceae bacterium]
MFSASLVFDARRAALCGMLLAAVSLTACGGSSGSSTTLPPPPPPPKNLPQHIIVVVQENRTVDNLMQGYPGADTVNSGVDSTGKTHALAPVSLVNGFDPDHTHKTGFVNEFNGGAQNGWDKEGFGCSKTGCPANTTAFAYVPKQEVLPYWQLAQQFVFADHVMQTNQGPSYEAHEYLIGATSGPRSPYVQAENPTEPDPKGGCDSKPGTTVALINLTTPFPGDESQNQFPCTDFTTIFDLLDAKHVSWKYYTPEVHNLWDAPNMVKHLSGSAEFKTNVVTPETQILTDIQQGKLAAVSYVVPAPSESDHARLTTLAGPGWVGTIANAVGASPYWKTTAIVVVWDDWGGWFDHYKSPLRPVFANDPYEYGFRVPMLLISPYAKAGLVDHTPRDFTAIVHFIEDVYGTGPLPTLPNEPASLETLTDDLFSDFNFSASASAYRPVSTNNYPASYYRNRNPHSEQRAIDSET